MMTQNMELLLFQLLLLLSIRKENRDSLSVARDQIAQMRTSRFWHMGTNQHYLWFWLASGLCCLTSKHWRRLCWMGISCVEHRHCLLFYKYCSKGTLNEVFHSGDELNKKLKYLGIYASG